MSLLHSKKKDLIHSQINFF